MSLTYNYWEQIYYKDNPELLDYYKNNYKEKLLTINLNFVENNNHGCKFHCPFCEWSTLNYNIYAFPKDEDVLEFINKYAADTSPIRLCGGGDPLYNFEKNKEKIKHLTEVIKTTGRFTQMTTKDIWMLEKYYRSPYLENIVSYTISVEDCNDFIRNTIKKLLEAGKTVRISKILNFDKNKEHIELDRLKHYLSYYSFNEFSTFKIVFRTNYIHSLPATVLAELQQQFNDYLQQNNINTNFNINPGGNVFKMLQLTNSEVTHCSNTTEQLFFELNKDKEDFKNFYGENL